MLRAMRGSTLERRAFVTLMGQALVGAGVLAISRPDPVPARDRDPNVFAGQETFEQLLVLGRERAWRELPIGERIGAIGMALRQRSEEHTSELQSPCNLVCRLLLEKKKN